MAYVPATSLLALSASAVRSDRSTPLTQATVHRLAYGSYLPRARNPLPTVDLM